MSEFDDLLIETASEFADGFGEPITYTPKGGAARSINAIVDRNPPERINVRGDIVTPKMTIMVANDATAGISSAELDAYGNDKVTVALRIGGVAQEFGVYLPDASAGNFMDAGMITLDLK
jgi:hypothetical protein